MINSNQKIIKHKVGLLNLAEELGNVSKACKIMGLSRDTLKTESMNKRSKPSSSSPLIILPTVN